jgi:hypothetical protein
MNRGAILAQGCTRLGEGVSEDVEAGTIVSPPMNSWGNEQLESSHRRPHQAHPLVKSSDFS